VPFYYALKAQKGIQHNYLVIAKEKGEKNPKRK
jgi:hypothetical protein